MPLPAIAIVAANVIMTSSTLEVLGITTAAGAATWLGSNWVQGPLESLRNTASDVGEIISDTVDMSAEAAPTNFGPQVPRSGADEITQNRMAEPVAPDKYAGPGPDHKLPDLESGETFGSQINLKNPDPESIQLSATYVAAANGIHIDPQQTGPRVENTADTELKTSTDLTIKSMGL